MVVQPLSRLHIAPVGVLPTALLAWLIASTGCTKPPPTAAPPTKASAQEPAAEAIAEVRRGYFGRDFWACARTGEAEHPGSAPLRAWTIACAARADEPAVPLAEAMLAEKPGEPWALWARAAALIDDDRRGPTEGITAARAAAAALSHPDGTWLVGRALVVHGTYEEALAFFASVPERVGSSRPAKFSSKRTTSTTDTRCHS